MRDIAAVVVRVLALYVTQWVVLRVTDIGSDEAGGANIGAGLLAFLVTMVVAFVWSLADGLKSTRVLADVLRWLVVAVVFGVLSALSAQVSGSGFDADVLRSDLAMVSPFAFGLVAGPAALGLAVGMLIARRRRPVG